MTTPQIPEDAPRSTEDDTGEPDTKADEFALPNAPDQEYEDD